MSDTADLNRLISQAEARVLAADARLSGRKLDLKSALAAQAGKLAAGAAVAAGAVALLVWRPWQSRAQKKLRRQRKALDRLEQRHFDRALRSRRSPDLLSGWSLFKLVTLIWPMLPFRVPSPGGPKMTAFLMGLGVPITERSAAVDTVPPPMVESNFDPLLYYGRWYEIARLPLKFERQCAGDVTATYVPTSDGTELRVLNACRSVSGSYEIAEGVARIPDASAPAKLQVTFAPAFTRGLSFVWAEYWVLQVDSDYSIALVGTPDRKSLWFLARKPSVDDETFQQMSEFAIAQGYDLGALIRTPHSPQPTTALPVSNQPEDHEFAQ